MPTNVSSYIASRYLTADTPNKPSKKRKRKHAAADSGLLITDDDETGWSKPSSRSGGGGGGGGAFDDDDDDKYLSGAAAISGTLSEFRKAKKSSWTTLGGVGGADGGSGGPKRKNGETRSEYRATGADGADDADAVIAAAAAEATAAAEAEDAAPVVAGVDVVDDDALADVVSATGRKRPVLMSDGTHAGLQSAAAVTAQLEKRRREEREQYERERRQRRKDRKEGLDGDEEVVYRDATGRRINLAERRQEVQQEALAAAAKERAAAQALGGDVQRAEATRRREQLADAALLPVARGADDETMNAALKAQARWNDPMAPFLRDKEERQSKSKSGSAKAVRPVYRGAAAPNRYGIRPGYRWDGVDRSNGFEAERFKAINQRERNRGLEYQWQMDE